VAASAYASGSVKCFPVCWSGAASVCKEYVCVCVPCSRACRLSVWTVTCQWDPRLGCWACVDVALDCTLFQVQSVWVWKCVYKCHSCFCCASGLEVYWSGCVTLAIPLLQGSRRVWVSLLLGMFGACQTSTLSVRACHS
jgi:hypothetical protein